MANGPTYLTTQPLFVNATITAATSGTSDTDTTTATGFSTASLVSGRQADIWKSNTATATQYIYFNTNIDATPANMIAIHNHNLPSGGTTTLEYDNDNDGWADADVTVAATFTFRAGSMYVEMPGTVQRRYWRVKMEGITVAPEIGEIVIGQKTEMTRAFRWGVVESIMPHVAVSTTQSGVPWFLTLVPDTRQFAISWASMNKSQQDELVILHGLLTKGTVTVVPFTDEIESARSTEVYEVWASEPLSITINRDPDRHGGLTLIETSKNLGLS